MVDEDVGSGPQRNWDDEEPIGEQRRAQPFRATRCHTEQRR
jgi:hypothetical protein